MQLATFNAQFRKIGLNYNRVVKDLYAHFSQKKVLALLYKMKTETRKPIAVGKKIAAREDEFRQRW